MHARLAPALLLFLGVGLLAVPPAAAAAPGWTVIAQSYQVFTGDTVNVTAIGPAGGIWLHFDAFNSTGFLFSEQTLRTNLSNGAASAQWIVPIDEAGGTWHVTVRSDTGPVGEVFVSVLRDEAVLTQRRVLMLEQELAATQRQLDIQTAHISEVEHRLSWAYVMLVFGGICLFIAFYDAFYVIFPRRAAYLKLAYPWGPAERWRDRARRYLAHSVSPYDQRQDDPLIRYLEAPLGTGPKDVLEANARHWRKVDGDAAPVAGGDVHA